MIDFLLGVPGKLKTISDYLTTNMAAARMALIDNLTALRVVKIDNLDAAISSRAPASTALTNATWTNALAAKLLAVSPYGSTHKQLPSAFSIGGWLRIKSNKATFTTLDAAGSFTTLARCGATGAITAASTYATICNVSGAGFLTHIITPACTSALSTFLIRVTINGVQSVSSFTTTSAGFSYRVVLGHVAMGPGFTVAGTGETEAIGGQNDEGFGAAATVQNGVPTHGEYRVIPTADQVIALGLPVVRFESSLLVEISVSTLNATTDPQRYGYVGYRLSL